MVDNQFKYTTWLWRHCGSVAYPGGDLSCSRTTTLALQSQQKVFKATYPPCYWHWGGHKWLKGHVPDIRLSLETGYSRFLLLLREGTGSVHGSMLRAEVSTLLALCCCGTTPSHTGLMANMWKVEQELWRVSQAELQPLVRESLPVAH